MIRIAALALELGPGLAVEAAPLLASRRLSPVALIEAVRLVAAGEALLAPSVTRTVIEAFAASAAATPPCPRRVPVPATPGPSFARGLWRIAAAEIFPQNQHVRCKTTYN